MVKTLVLNFERERELMRSDDPLTRDIIGLLQKYRYDDDRVLRRIEEINDHIWTPQPKAAKRRGAKTKWSDSGNYYAWLAIEHEFQTARKRDPTIRLSAAIRDKFRRLKRKPWCILWDGTGGNNHLLIRNGGRARSRHAAGRKLVLSNPALTAITKQRLELLGHDAAQYLRRNSRGKTR